MYIRVIKGKLKSKCTEDVYREWLADCNILQHRQFDSGPFWCLDEDIGAIYRPTWTIKSFRSLCVCKYNISNNIFSANKTEKARISHQNYLYKRANQFLEHFIWLGQCLCVKEKGY